jgi:TMEM175 potassium channel family protein
MNDQGQRPQAAGAGAEVGARNPPRRSSGLVREDDEHARAAFERKHDPSRVLALSDGVFAILITLLVLDIHVPDLGPGQSLAGALRDIWPSLTAFVISFIVAGMYWVGHRDLFALIRRTDRWLVWLNVVYLLPLCLLPFATSLLGRYDLEPVAVRIYGTVLVAIAVMRVVIWLYATRRPPLLWSPLSQDQRRAGLALGILPGLLYLLAILLAGVAPGVSLAIYAAGPVLYFLGITVLRGSRKRDSEYADFT